MKVMKWVLPILVAGLFLLPVSSGGAEAVPAAKLSVDTGHGLIKVGRRGYRGFRGRGFRARGFRVRGYRRGFRRGYRVRGFRVRRGFRRHYRRRFAAYRPYRRIRRLGYHRRIYYRPRIRYYRHYRYRPIYYVRYRRRGCYWLKRRARITGSHYWWRRYKYCRRHYW